MKVVVNGEERQLAQGTTVADLLPVERRGVAVAIDGEVVPRPAWESLALAEGQRIELLEATAGG